MNIACDARALVGPRTGVGTWTTHLVSGMAGDSSSNLLLGASKTFDLPEDLRLPNVNILPRPRLPVPGSLWLHISLPRILRKAQADVFIGSLAIIPRTGVVPSISMVHDLTPMTHPDRHTLKTRSTFNPFIKHSLEKARAVVVGSQATRDEVLNYFPSVADKLNLISYGVDDYFSPSNDPKEGEAIRHLVCNGRPYILHLGTLEPRKGLQTLVEAWNRLNLSHTDAPDLVLAGGLGWDTNPLLEQINHSPDSHRIHRPGYVDREQARALMRHAECFVLASEAEGFGLPLAEAMACGAPCIASDIPALRESGGDATLLVPVGDSGALAETISRVLDPEVSLALRQSARDRIAALAWGPKVEQWRRLIHEVVG